jgi:hypothetical protein
MVDALTISRFAIRAGTSARGIHSIRADSNASAGAPDLGGLGCDEQVMGGIHDAC